jgi:hypothetical protein
MHELFSLSHCIMCAAQECTICGNAEAQMHVPVDETGGRYETKEGPFNLQSLNPSVQDTPPLMCKDSLWNKCTGLFVGRVVFWGDGECFSILTAGIHHVVGVDLVNLSSKIWWPKPNGCTGYTVRRPRFLGRQ